MQITISSALKHILTALMSLAQIRSKHVLLWGDTLSSCDLKTRGKTTISSAEGLI